MQTQKPHQIRSMIKEPLWFLYGHQRVDRETQMVVIEIRLCLVHEEVNFIGEGILKLLYQMNNEFWSMGK